jgi:hypothetical protein
MFPRALRAYIASMRKIVVLLVALFAATSLFAADEMRKLDFLAGEWRGDAWMQLGPDKKGYAIQRELVQSKLGGQVLLVEGQGRLKLEDGTGGQIVHDAMAVVSWDEAKKTYRFQTWVAGRGGSDTTLDLVAPNKAVWAIESPRGRTRFTITVTEDGKWNEVGEQSSDGGATWRKFFEMNLVKEK